MLVVKSWLEEYIDLSGYSDTEIGDFFTSLGHEVEGITYAHALDELIVVGQVKELKDHPKADQLRVCGVDVGQGSLLQIVCGAGNVRLGAYVAVAQVGAQLPGQNTKMKEVTLRGVQSAGMICSAGELGVVLSGADDEGILIFSPSPQLGITVEEVLRGKDTVWDLAITPNRPDCLGYIGLSRDLAAKLGRPLVMPSRECVTVKEKTADFCKVEIEDAALCARFVALYVDRIQGGAHAPYWMQRRLALSGVRSRSLLVDVTNYVMLEWGQPLHAYDVQALPKKLLKVERTQEHTQRTVVTLDGEERSLQGGDLVISDGEEVLSLAGIMGGKSSWIQDTTTACVLEVADFHGQSIRQSVKRHRLSSESSYRFERGVDRQVLVDVAQRAAYLLYSLAEEQGLPLPAISSAPVDVQMRPYQSPKVALRVERARKLLNLVDLKVEQCIDLLDALECHLLDRKGSRLVYSIPSHRSDLVREVDLIEEIARLLSYDVVASLPPEKVVQEGVLEHPLISWSHRVREILAQLGLYEVILYPFTCSKDLSRCLIDPNHPFYSKLKISNPLTPEFSYLQSTQVVAMLRCLEYNRAHSHKGTRFFQVGRGFLASEVVEKLRNSDDVLWKEVAEVSGGHLGCVHFEEHTQEEKQRPGERTLVSWVVEGPWRKKSWQSSEQELSFFHLKEQLESVLKSLGVRDYELRPLGEGVVPFLHALQSAAVYTGNGVCVGYLGMIHPRVCDRWDFDLLHRPGVVELNLESLWKVSQTRFSVTEFSASSFPACYRDLALAVPRSVTHGEVMACIDQFPERKHLKTAELFDLYTGESVAEDEKSFAYALSFESSSKTLKDREVDGELAQLVSYLKEKLGAVRR